jgi:hypothetical protein
MINEERLKVSNEIIRNWHPTLCLTVKSGKIHASWYDYRGYHEKPWLCRKGSFFPSIANKISIGGTSIQAITQLVRWTRELSVLPLSTWEYWCSPTVGLKPKDKILELLNEMKYPKHHKCCWCGIDLQQFDWFSLGKKEGPGCLYYCLPMKETLANLERQGKLKNDKHR